MKSTISSLNTINIILLVMVAKTATAQELYQKQLSGIYLTKEDFDKDILTHASDRKGDKLEEVRGWGDIKLVRREGDIYFKFGEFYGYRDRGYKFFSFGRRAPFHLFGYYQIMDVSGLIVYNQRIPHIKYRYVESPYFSTNLDSEKYPLNIRNLKKFAYLQGPIIHQLRWYQRNLPSLAFEFNGKTIINELLLNTVDGKNGFNPQHYKISGKEFTFPNTTKVNQ